MKKLMTVLLAAILCLGLAGVAMADGTDEIIGWVVVEETVELDLDIPNKEAAVWLGPAVAGFDYEWEETFTAGAFKFSHNHPVDMKITAAAVADGGNATNDITLKIYLGAWYTLLVGPATTGSAVVWIGPAGAYIKTMGAGASATLAGTPHGTYKWTVTFTAIDA